MHLSKGYLIDQFGVGYVLVRFVLLYLKFKYPYFHQCFVNENMESFFSPFFMLMFMLSIFYTFLFYHSIEL